MTSTASDLIRDFRIGRDGEDLVHKFLLEKEGVIIENVGEQRLGWDLQAVGIDGTKLGINEKTFKEEVFLKRFIKRYGKTFEVKRDKTSDRTHNFYWEAWSNYRVKNAGCMTDCKADTLVIARSSEFIFLDRPKLLSWVFYQLFMETDIAKKWKSTTFRGGRKVMMSAKVNPDVLGILMPIDQLKESPACLLVYDRKKDVLTELNIRKR